MEFKDRLRELRSKHGLTQEELGKRFNVIKQTISSWENGNSRPDIDSASRLADFFDVSTDFLLGRTDNPEPIKMIHLSDLPNRVLGEDYPDEEVAKLLQDAGIEKLKLTRDISVDELKALIALADTIKAKAENNQKKPAKPDDPFNGRFDDIL